MKKLISLFLVVPFLAGCLITGSDVGAVLDSIPSPGDAVTNAPALPPVPPVVETAKPVPGGLVAAGAFVRPVVAQGPGGVLFVAAEGPRMASVCLYVYQAGKWAGGPVMVSEHGGQVDAGRIYVPDLVVDADGWAWTTARAGIKEWGKMYGPCVWIRAPDGKGVFKFLAFSKGAARIALDPARPGRAIVMSKDGAWAEVDRTGRRTVQGSFPAGKTGEKLAFTIDGPTWWTAMNGYSAQSAAVASGPAAAGKRLTWADWSTYQDQSSDLCYCSVAVGSNGVGYVAAVLGGHLRVQVVQRGAVRFPVNRLGDLGSAKLEDRCPPKLVQTGLGMVAVWSGSAGIMAVRVDEALAGRAKPVRIGSGAMPSVCALADGRLAVVSVTGAGLALSLVNVP